MARITDIYLVDVPAENALIVNGKVSVPDIPGFIGDAFITLEEYIKDQGMIQSDTPFLQITGNDPNSFEIMAGITVSKEVKGSGEIRNYCIPAGKRIFSYWLGDNSEMPPLYDEMAVFAKELGYETAEGCFEYYLNSPDYGLDKLLTKVVMLLLD